MILTIMAYPLCLLIFSHFRLMYKLEIVGSEIFEFQMKLVQARVKDLIYDGIQL